MSVTCRTLGLKINLIDFYPYRSYNPLVYPKRNYNIAKSKKNVIVQLDCSYIFFLRYVPF